jgi:hypothetical protein
MTAGHLLFQYSPLTDNPAATGQWYVKKDQTFVLLNGTQVGSLSTGKVEMIGLGWGGLERGMAESWVNNPINILTVVKNPIRPTEFVSSSVTFSPQQTTSSAQFFSKIIRCGSENIWRKVIHNYLSILFKIMPNTQPGLLAASFSPEHCRNHCPLINAITASRKGIANPRHYLDEGGQPGRNCLSLTMRAVVTRYVSNLTSKKNTLS